MDKIFKNDKIMGIVAVVTLVLVGLMYWRTCKTETTTTTTTTGPAPEQTAK